MSVAEIRDEAEIVQVLGQDPIWAAYAITDLDPPYRKHARFLGVRRDERLSAVLLTYRPPGFTALLPYGDDEGVAALFEGAPNLPARPFIILSESHKPIAETRYDLDVWRMYRMAVRPEQLRAAPPVDAGVRRLSPGDVDAVESVYRHWESTFFQPELLADGLYAGAFVEGELAAIAGTHTRSARFGIGTIGGVFTLPAFRGRGLATAVTATVAHALADDGIDLIALNVRQDNHPAIAAYHRIGFEVHLPYWEGDARLRSDRDPSTGQ